MAGIINQARQPQPETQPANGQPDDQSVERVVIAAIKVIHDPKVKQQLIEMMRQAGDPVQALVSAVFLVMRQLYERSRRSIPADVLGAASAHVLRLLGELAEAAGLFQVTPELLQQAGEAGLEQFKQEQAAQQQGAPQTGAPQPPAAAPQPMNMGI